MQNAFLVQKDARHETSASMECIERKLIFLQQILHEILIPDSPCRLRIILHMQACDITSLLESLAGKGLHCSVCWSPYSHGVLTDRVQAAL